ncbi:tRNA 2-selenouridine(34) synthase MnmH [archaeon]|nr:tRNA 2-selenouridine(34) synthase MnmH [archaeon]|tara:strand:- start:273 stop:1208 length:936 start_codon:yes stop_codon:yes gene_type:complete
MIVDVRSPIEFKEDHIPNAINIPLFSNEERAIVGTIYKKEGKDDAINKGLEFLSPKLPEMIKQYKELKQPITIYCFRGGMRSNSIASLLKSLGFKVKVLEGGYKTYRKKVRDELENFKIKPKIYVLYGLTGSGKTEILNQLNNSLDLEGLAQHRGSVFGDINLKPNSQKMFESLLLKKLNELQKEETIFIEGESRKIGKVQIPLAIWQQMQKAKKIKVVNSIQDRINRIDKEYCNKIDIDLFSSKLDQIEKYLGKKKVVDLKLLLKENKLKEFIKILLLNYYDKLYAHTVDSKEYEFEISNKEELNQNIYI